MGIDFTKEERKSIYRQSRLLLKGLIIALGVMVLFGLLPLPAVLAGFVWLLLLAGFWIIAHHVIEWVQNNS